MVAAFSTPSRPVLTVRVSEASEMTGLSRTHLYGLMEQGKLPYSKVGRCRLIRISDLDQLIASLRVGRTDDPEAGSPAASSPSSPLAATAIAG